MKKRRNGSGTLYRRGSTWYAKIKVGGKWVCKSTETADKDKARKALDAMAVGHDMGDAARLAAIAAALRHEERAPRIADAWEVYARCHGAGLTAAVRGVLAARWQVFAQFCEARGAAFLRDLTRGDAADFVREVAATRAPATANLYADSVRRIIHALTDGAKCAFDGLPRLRVEQSLRRALTDEELGRVLGTADGEMRTLCHIGAYTGLRLSDAVRVKWEDFTADGAALIVRPRKTAHSSGRVVSVPVHAELRRVIGDGGGKCGYLMPQLAALKHDALGRRVMGHLQKCVGFERGRKPQGYRRSMPEVGFHSLRATFITRLANAGTPLPVVQSLVGHTTPTMTMRYYRASADVAAQFLARLPKWGANGENAEPHN